VPAGCRCRRVRFVNSGQGPAPVSVAGPGRHGARRRDAARRRAAVICNGCDQRCGASGVRPGGTGRWNTQPRRLAGTWPLCRRAAATSWRPSALAGELPDPSHEPGGEPPRAGAEPGFTCARVPVRIAACSGPAEAATPTVELPTIPAAPRAISLTFLVSQREGVVDVVACRPTSDQSEVSDLREAACRGVCRSSTAAAGRLCPP
jgi:hypothetical protein